MTVEAVKDKMWKKCGTCVDSMSLLEPYVIATNAKLADLSQDLRPFGFYSPHDGQLLIVLMFVPSALLVMKAHHILLFPVVTDCMLLTLIHPPSHQAVGWRTPHWWRNTLFLMKPLLNVMVLSESLRKSWLVKIHLLLDSKKQISEDCMKDLCANVKAGINAVEPREERVSLNLLVRLVLTFSWILGWSSYDEPFGET
ncbi:hypothetical protein Leryth_016034 [Lithospermum erythrorhizon]|nr:hypothetical protein Leryth_016034 [Lithospermum erythrorhizon]